MDWKQMRKAMKHSGAKLCASPFGTYWFEIPLDPEIARTIISHPAVVFAYETDSGDVYRWRAPEESPARKVFNAMNNSRKDVQ